MPLPLLSEVKKHDIPHYSKRNRGSHRVEFWIWKSWATKQVHCEIIFYILVNYFIFHHAMYKYSLLILTLFFFIHCQRYSVPSYQAVVASDYSGTPGAIADGTPTYATIGEALSMAPKTNKDPFVIYIHKGRYYEKLSVDKTNICFLGESRDETILGYDASGDTPNPEGGTYGTRGCFTLRIIVPDFRAENLTIENGFDYPANAAKCDDDPTKMQNPQAVALMTDSGSDQTVFRNCKIAGYQDTFYANAGRHYFYRCRILGHVDFIFGAGQAVFDDCDIVSRNRQEKIQPDMWLPPAHRSCIPMDSFLPTATLSGKVRKSPRALFGLAVPGIRMRILTFQVTLYSSVASWTIILEPQAMHRYLPSTLRDAESGSKLKKTPVFLSTAVMVRVR